MNFFQYAVFFLFLQQSFFLHQCKAVLGSKHLSNGLFDKYYGRLEKIKGVADNFNQIIFNSARSFPLFLSSEN